MVEINKKYVVVVDIGNNKTLTYTAVIIKLQNNFITFTERSGRLLTYNLNRCVSFEEVKQ